MQRPSFIWGLVTAGFLGLLANSFWTTQQLNFLLGRQHVRNLQHKTNARVPLHLKIRIRGNGIRAEDKAVGTRPDSSVTQLGWDSDPADQLYNHKVTASSETGHSPQHYISGQSLKALEAVPLSEARPSLVSNGLRISQELAAAAGSRPQDASQGGETIGNRSPQDREQAFSLLGSWAPMVPQTVNRTGRAIPEKPTAFMLAYAAAPAQLPPAGMTCQAWLLSADQRRYSRDFEAEPVTVLADMFGEKGAQSNCSVPCIFPLTDASSPLTADTPEGVVPAFDAYPAMLHPLQKPAHFGLSYYRHMESLTNYPERAPEALYASGVKIVMSHQLSSDAPATYISWPEYDFMRPPQQKTAEAVAFISNCGAKSFRLDAVRQLSQAVRVDSYGICEQNVQDTVASKDDVLPLAHFTLAFENSQEEDYVTEKFAQALTAGSVPVVIGAPNIEDFAVAPDSMIVLKSKEDIAEAGLTLQRLLQNTTAYEEMLAWKRKGPQDSFIALVDINAVSSNCRLCTKVKDLWLKMSFLELAAVPMIDLQFSTDIVTEDDILAVADLIHAQEDVAMPARPCKCMQGASGTTVHHILVRERGGFRFRDIFLEDSELTTEALHAAIHGAFVGHQPVWMQQRPDFLAQRRPSAGKRLQNGLNIYRVYEMGISQRAALYGGVDLDSDSKVKAAVQQNACLQLEVIFL